MMKETNFYLVSYLPEEVNKEAMRLAYVLEQKFDTHTFVNSWEPHLTVGSGLFVPQDKVEDMQTDLAAIANTLSKIDVQLQGIGSIDNLNPKIAKNPYVVYIDVVKTPDLQNIFDTLEQYEKYRKDGYAITSYNPHVTLAYDDLTQEHYHDAVSFLENENPSFRFTLDNFSIVRFNENSARREEYQRFHFKP